MANSQVGQKDPDTPAKPFHNHNAVHQTSHSRRGKAINTILAKWEEKTADYICNYNLSKKWVKKVR